ncbi:O-antigen polymerase [Lonepinella sp. BR2904]|uniref:O-antigen polymerase n=1 Tax=Lonepinella sp. BR2904 TaxID=3434551 RepID=UPI003F6E3926
MASNIRNFFLSLGILQCFILLIAYSILYFIKLDLCVIGLFIYSLFLGFFILKNKVKRLLINDSAVIFLLFLFLYGIFNGTIQLILNGIIDDNVYEATVIYAATVPCFLLGFSFKKRGTYKRNYDEHINFIAVSNKYNALLLFILLLLMLYKTYFFYSIGMLFSSSALNVNRLEAFAQVSQIDVVIGLLISSIFLYFIYYYPKLNRKTKIIISIFLIYYVLLLVMAGNRRDFIPMLLGAFWVFVNLRNIRFSTLGFIILLFGIFSFNILGSLRANMANGLEMNSETLLVDAMTSNEFVYPFYTLSDEVQWSKRNDYEYEYGKTILLNPITVFIPRSIYPEKPTSLANDFVWKKYGNQESIGYAYTPVSEFFINFGALGPAIVYIFIGAFFAYIQMRKSQILHFLVFVTILDFCRGEVATFFYQFLFISFFILILPKFKRLMVKQ